ncbi:MAG: putative transcriptional regulator, MerR family [Ramlibacter sp.]|nr:putative transcriptional regulator, MerR family [Ramlibacter sp.]MDB5911535.1 putative transcriptional regulator, MerR family [Ramlibacter sp.]
MPATLPQDEGLPIAAVEQTTGIARATLRIWERRYGFPDPGRDRRGERSYPEDQIRKLRLIADLMNRGHRPGRLVQLTDEQLASLARPAGELASCSCPGGNALDDPVLLPLKNHDLAGLAHLLEESVRKLGLARFVLERMPQMNFNVGLAWARGELQVYEEHLYTEVVQHVVRNAMPARHHSSAGTHPRVLLATFPEESHGLGLLMAQAVLALEGCSCTSLGVRVPIRQLLAAAAAFHADVVGLSFAASMNPAQVLRGLEQLRGELAPQVAIWAGGSSPAIGRHKLSNVLRVADIRDLPGIVAQWRALHAGRP